jgi:Protein of unknown function (DUF3179)
MQSGRPVSRWFYAVFCLSGIVAVGLFFIPAFVIRPFHYQSPRALWLAMAIKQRAPLAALIAGLVFILMGLVLWRTARRGPRFLLAMSMLVVASSATMARLNYFEWMFHPLRQAGFESIAKTKLESGEMVLTLRFNSDARAYPVREMAYHHIVNDVVGGVPVAVTY